MLSAACQPSRTESLHSSKRIYQHLLRSAIRMAEGSFGCNPVSDELFKFFDLRETTLFLSRPEDVMIDPDFKDASHPGYECEFPDFVLERGQQLLCHPGRSKKPPALSAVFDFYSRTFRRHDVCNVAAAPMNDK